MRTVATLIALAVSLPAAAQVTQVGYGTLTGTQIVGFDDIAGGAAPGTNYDSTFVSNGVGFGERFAGQSITDVGGSDQITGAPSGALSLVAGAPGQNLNVFTNGASQVLTGLGSAGFPDFDAIGEGSFALIFSSDQSQFGFQLVGGNGGSATVDFYARDGALIDSVVLGSLADTFYGFSRDGGVKDIAGISIWNTDPAGIGFDELKHDVVSTVPPTTPVPEPSTYALMLAGLAGIGFVARRRRRG